MSEKKLKAWLERQRKKFPVPKFAVVRSGSVVEEFTDEQLEDLLGEVEAGDEVQAKQEEKVLGTYSYRETAAASASSGDRAYGVVAREVACALTVSLSGEREERKALFGVMEKERDTFWKQLKQKDDELDRLRGELATHQKSIVDLKRVETEHAERMHAMKRNEELMNAALAFAQNFMKEAKDNRGARESFRKVFNDLPETLQEKLVDAVQGENARRLQALLLPEDAGRGHN